MKGFQATGNEYPALQNMKFLNFRIPNPDLDPETHLNQYKIRIRIRNTVSVSVAQKIVILDRAYNR